jgi:hypothetical protein
VSASGTITVINIICVRKSSYTLKVQTPEEIAGTYLDSYLTVNPLKFNITAQLILPEPLDLCSNKPTNADKWTGKIVLIVDSKVPTFIYSYVSDQESCTPEDFARIILQENAKTAGFAIFLIFF